MIPIRTNEQLVELAARSTWLLSLLRAMTKDHENSLAIATLCKNEEIKMIEDRIDGYLEGLDATKFENLKSLIKQLSIHEDDGAKRKSIKTLPEDGSNNSI